MSKRKKTIIAILGSIVCVAVLLLWGMFTIDCMRAYDLKEPVFAIGGEYIHDETKGVDIGIFKGLGYTVEVEKDIHPDFGKEYVVSVEVYVFGKVVAGAIT